MKVKELRLLSEDAVKAELHLRPNLRMTDIGSLAVPAGCGCRTGMSRIHYWKVHQRDSEAVLSRQ